MSNESIDVNQKALAQLDRVEKATRAFAQAQAELQSAQLELARLRLQAGGSSRALNRAIDTLLSW